MSEERVTCAVKLAGVSGEQSRVAREATEEVTASLDMILRGLRLAIKGARRAQVYALAGHDACGDVVQANTGVRWLLQKMFGPRDGI